MRRSATAPAPARPVAPPIPAGMGARLARLAEQEAVFAYLLLLPAAAILAVFLAYPFCYGIWLSLNTGSPGEVLRFVGLGNYARLWDDEIFHLVVRNSLVYTVSTEVLKVAFGLAVAHLLNRSFRGRTVVRAALLLPWIVPTVLSTLAWSWILDPTFGILDWTLLHLGIVKTPPNWLFTLPLPMVALVTVNVWRGVPFFALSFLGGLQAIPVELYEAAQLDGAAAWARFRYVTLPLLRPVILTVLLLSTIVTLADFQLIYLLTGGGPFNQTQVFSTYAYKVGLASGNVGLSRSAARFGRNRRAFACGFLPMRRAFTCRYPVQNQLRTYLGAAVSLSMFPFLSGLVFGVIVLIRRERQT